MGLDILESIKLLHTIVFTDMGSFVHANPDTEGLLSYRESRADTQKVASVKVCWQASIDKARF